MKEIIIRIINIIIITVKLLYSNDRVNYPIKLCIEAFNKYVSYSHM